MRIVFLVVFYIATYVARIADGGETTNIMPGNGIKHILRQKSEAIQDEITEKLIDDKITWGTNKHRGQSLLINRIDSLSQSRKILNDKSARIKRSFQKRRKRAKNSDIARHQSAFQNNDVDDIDEEEEDLSKTRGLPIWQISEPMVAAIDLNSTTNPMIVKQTEMINRSSFKRPRSGNLNSYRVSNEASSLIATDRHPNSHGLFDTNVPDKNLVFYKFPNSKPNRRSPVSKKLDKVSLSAYPPEISVDIDSSNFKPSRRFEWQRNGNLKDQRNIQDLPDSHPTDSNERFLLVPVSNDLYVLKNIQDSPSVNGMITAKHKLLERNKNKGNMSAILSFKAHMHHDVKDVGKAYLHHRAFNNHYLSDYNTNYLYTDLNPRVDIDENKENITPLSYPNFLYPGIAFQTHPDVIDVPEILDQQISLPDYKHISLMDIDSDTKMVPYDSTTVPTSPFFDMSEYDVSSYPKENTNDRQSNILPTKLNELNSQLDSGNYESSLEYNEISIESTTTDFQSTFGTFDDTDKNRINFIHDISTQYRSVIDTSINQDNSYPSQLFVNIENILNNQDTNEDSIGSEIITLSEYSDKKSTFNDFNYDNKFIDETLFSNYTTINLDSFLNIKDYTTSVPLLSDTDEWSLKKKQSNVENPRALLKAIEPLSSELEKLLTAVKLVNQSISNVQNRLCDKENIVRSARIERESKERIYSKDDFNNQSLDTKKKIKGKNIVDQISNDIEFKRKIVNNYFLNKLTTPLRKREDSIRSNRKIINNRNFFKKKKLNKSKFPKLDNVEKHRLSHLRFNRNLKSLTKNYKVQAKPTRQFESRLKRVIRKTTPVIISSHLLKSNIPSKNNFINRLTQDSPKNKSISLSGHNKLSIFSDIIADKDNRVHFLSNNKRDLARYNITDKLSSDTEKKYSPVDPQSYREITAYLDILRLLNMTKKPYIVSPISTTEFFATTASILPIEYPIERSTTIASRTTITWGKESPEVTESILYEYLTGIDYEYYEQNYTGTYEDYEYEYRGNVTAWYDYMKETTTEMEITATTIKYSKFVETMKEIATPTKKMDYEVVETISLTRLSVTLSAFTITMPTTPPQLYTTELPIFPIDMEVFTTEIITEETVAMLIEITETSTVPTTVKLTTESVMLLTPFLEGMTDITLRITIPTVTSIEEASIITEKEIVEGTLTTLMTEMTQSFLTETSTSLFTISTVPLFTTVETAELAIQITTPTMPILTTSTVVKKLRTTTSIEKPASVTERMTTGISPIIISTESTAILGENTTLQAITSKITYVTKIETRIEEVISFTTQALTFAPTVQVTESTTETLITISEITITATTSSPTISERTETILSTLAEKIATLTPEEEESPVTQIEKTITAEEMTTTETPTTIETVTSTESLMISETSTSSTTPTTLEVSPTSTETLPTTIETKLTKILTTSEISITDTLSTENRTITKPLTTTGISILIPTTTEIQTTIKTLTIESTSTSSIIPITVTTIKTVPTTLLITTKRPTTSVKTTFPITSLKLMTTTSVTNITLRETPNTTISSTFLTTIIPATTASVETTVPITPLKLTTLTLLSLVTNTTLSETPCTISTTFLTEEIETTTFSMTSISTISTTKILPTTLSTLITTSSFLNTSVAINRTFFTTIFTTLRTSTIETTTLSMTLITTTSPFETTTRTTLIPPIAETNTTLSEITFSTLSTEMVENTTLTSVSLTEIVSTTSLIELTTEELTTWITTEETTIIKAATLMTYLPSTTMFFIETTTGTTLFILETVTAPTSEEISTIEEVTAVSLTIAEESSLIEEITNVTSTTVEISIPTKITLTEKSTISATETSIANTSLASIAMTTVSLLREATTETISLTEMTFTPLSEFTSSILIISETPATTPEVSSVLPKTISEEFTTTLTSPLITYTLETFTTLPIERTTVLTLAPTKEMPEAKTEYYVAKEPFYEEEYEEYEEYEIPTDKWYYYEEYETTTKSKTTMASSTAKYTKLLEETSPLFFEGTTSSYETKTLEFTMYSTTSTSIYTGVILTTSKIPYMYTEGEFTLSSSLETSTMTFTETITTIEVETEFTTSITSKEEESTTMALTFGSTEEYTLLPSTVFEIVTKPLEYLTIPAKYTEPTSKFLTPIWHTPKFTKPEEIPEIELEKTSTSERILTETEFTVEKLISFFVSSTLTTLSEREAIGVTTASIVFSEMETEIGYEVTTLATTKEEITPSTTMFITPEIVTELITMRKTTIGREEEKKQILKLLDDLEQREREVAEREERIKEKEQQWEEKKHKEMMQREKEKAQNITIITNTTTSYVTTITETSIIPLVSTQNLTVASTEKIRGTLVFGTSLAEIITTSTETTPLYITEEDIFATYFTETTKEITTQEIFSTYIVEVTEETAVRKLYTTEESTSVTYVTKEIEEIYITNYTTLTSYITAPIVDLYNISLVSIETTTPYTTEETYTTSYETIYLSEPLFISSTMLFTSPITWATDEFIALPTPTFEISSYEIGATSTPIPTSTKERYITSCITLCNEFPFISPTMTLTGRTTTAIDITILPVPVTTPISYTEEIIDIYSELFTSSASEFINTTTTLAISTITEIEYDEEIESLKEKLRKKERELKEREKILQEKEEKLKEDKIEFEMYMKEMKTEEMHTLFATSEKPIISNLSTPVPPTEKTTVKTQVTTQIKKITEKKENQTTTKMITSRHETTRVKDIGEKERTRYVSEKATEVEEEIVTKRICLNVLENTTIPFVVKKMCLPYLPEKNREQKSVGRLNRKLFSFSNPRENKELKFQNFLSNFRYRGTRRAIETTRKINNLQLSYHEWLTNETTKPMRRFKGFTRIYERKEKPSLKKISTTINMQENSVHNFRSKTPLYQQHYYPYESLFQPTATFMLDNKKYEKTNAFFDHSLILARRNNFSNDKCIEKRNVLSTEENTRSWARENRANILNQKVTSAITEEKNLDEKESESYTVNVLHLSYNKDRETYEVISANPNENELTVIMSESNDDNNVNKLGDDDKITTPYHELEENTDLQEENDLQEEEDYFEDMLKNYINYEEHTTSIPIRDDKFVDNRSDDESKIENETKLLDQMWPTEKSTTYHLGGTRFWELEVTEPSPVLSPSTDKSKAIDLSVSRTTCLYVVLKNEINANEKAKRNIHYHKRNVYNKETKKYDISIEKRKIGLENITRKNMQNLRGLNRYEQNFGEKRKLDDFSRVSKEDSIITKTRKLCSVNENESKHRIIKDIKDKTKKKQSAKSQKSQNINSHSSKSCTDSCITNKKNSGKTITSMTANHHSQTKSNDKKKENHEKITNDITSDHKNQSVCVSRERKNHDYLNCICDIVDVIKNIKSILNRVSFSLDEIKALNCSIYKETQDKIVISIDSDTEETREFSQPHYNTESLKDQKYIKLEQLEDDFKSDLELGNDHDIVSLPGVNLNLPCNQDSDGITWLSTISRPSYIWKRTDGIAIFGFVAENGDLELRNVNAKDTGNYTCVTTYMGPETEEPVEATYEVRLQVVTLPRYIVHGENRYYTRSCDERDLDILVTYLPVKLNDIICEADMCNAYILTPSCSRNQITINILLLPSHIVKLMTIDPKHCNVICLKGIQDKLSLILSKNLQIFLGKTIIFRLPHYEQRLVPINEKPTFARWKRGRANPFAGRSNIGLFSSCPAGYGLHGTHCIPCNMDTYSEDGISYCKKCPPGTYQPNHGARVCRTCTDPLTKGCHNMLWSSFSAIMITLASLSVMLSIFLLFLWIICCAKKKFCVKKITDIISKADTFEQENPIEEQSLIKDVSENQDQWDNEYKAKKKRKKFYLNKKRRKQNERGKYEKMRIYEDEWGSHRIKNTPIVCPDSYRSHDDYNNYYSKQSYRKGPRLPECDFDT